MNNLDNNKIRTMKSGYAKYKVKEKSGKIIEFSGVLLDAYENERWEKTKISGERKQFMGYTKYYLFKTLKNHFVVEIVGIEQFALVFDSLEKAKEYLVSLEAGF